jgi:transcriptional regulator with XRE-family HTH domain
LGQLPLWLTVAPAVNLRDWRRRKHLTKEAVGELIGVAGISVGRYEAGRVPDPEVMRRIIAVTNRAVRPDDWFKAELQATRNQPLRSTNHPARGGT